MKKNNKKSAKNLRKENVKLSESLNLGNDLVLTDIVCYLRVSRLTEIQQEEVVKDIIYMLLDGESRDENAQQVIGENYKKFCDEIIENYPKMSKKDKIISNLSVIFNGAAILLIEFIVLELIMNMVLRRSIVTFKFEVVTAINLIIIPLIAIKIVNLICIDSFEIFSKKAKKVKIKIALLLSLPLIVVFGLSKFRYVLFSCNILVIVLSSIFFFVVGRYLKTTTEY